MTYDINKQARPLAWQLQVLLFECWHLWYFSPHHLNKKLRQNCMITCHSLWKSTRLGHYKKQSEYELQNMKKKTISPSINQIHAHLNNWVSSSQLNRTCLSRNTQTQIKGNLSTCMIHFTTSGQLTSPTTAPTGSKASAYCLKSVLLLSHSDHKDLNTSSLSINTICSNGSSWLRERWPLHAYQQ